MARAPGARRALVRLDQRVAPSRTTLAAWLLGAGLAVIWLVADPPSDDLAAAVYRADLFADHGWLLWDNGWYAGHHMLAYSIVYPPLGALLGPRLLGALATIASVVLFERLVTRAYGPRAVAGALWFALAAAANLYAGRVPFALGLAIGLGALVALQRGRPTIAGLLALATGLTSPVAGAFLALAAVAWGASGVRRQASGPRRGLVSVALALAAIVPPAVLSFLFPEGGTMPFDWTSYLPCLAVAVLLAVALPARERALRIGAVLYGALATVAFFLDTPFGGNAARLGMLFAGPILAAAILGGPAPERTRWREAAVAVAVLPLLFWPLAPVLKQLGAGDTPSRHEAYYRPLLAFLATRPSPLRVEVPPTRFHWEANYVPARFPIARGWERQLDVRYAHLFYQGPLTPQRYLRWLRDTGATYVALPVRAQPDYAARAERALLASGVPGLREVWRTPDWRVWAVSGARLAPITRIGRESFGARGGQVKVRWTRWWSAPVSLSEAPGGWTRVAPSGRHVTVTAG